MGAQLHRILRTAIIRGELVPGQAISEIEMSKRFSISRQPVREAFIKLGEERLIEVMPQRGTYVRKISVKEVLDARHLREIIELSIVREVTERHDASLIKTLRQIIVQQQKVKPGDSRSFLALDEELHRTLALHAGRELAWRVTESIKAQMDRVRFLTFDFATPMPQLVGEHINHRRHRVWRRRTRRANDAKPSARDPHFTAADRRALPRALRRGVRVGAPAGLSRPAWR